MSLASRTSLRTHFEVLSLGLEASSPRELPCPWLKDSTIFEPLKFRWKTPEILWKICKDLFLFSSSRASPEKKFLKTFFHLKKIFEDLFFLRTLAPVSLVLGLGLERVCLWPWPQFFCVCLALASSLVSWTPTLLLKLDHYSILRLCKNLIASFFSDRTQFVSSSGIKSSNLPVTFGIPQCSILGPFFYFDLRNPILRSLHHAYLLTTRAYFFLQINCPLSKLI